MKTSRSLTVELVASFLAVSSIAGCGATDSSDLAETDAIGAASEAPCDPAVESECTQDARGRWRRRQDAGVTSTADSGVSAPPPVVVADSGVTPTPPAADSGVTPPPTITGWPDATNTGYKHTGVTLSNSGTITVTKDGTVIDSVNVTGCIVVQASNVTIRRSKITATCFNGIEIRDWTGPKNLLIEDVEIDGSTADNCIAHGGYTARRVNLYGCADGAKISDNTTIEDSYVHGLLNGGDCHCDAFQSMGGGNMILRHNNLDVIGSNAGLMLGDEFGKLGVIVVDRNRFAGGNFGIYGGWNQQTQTTPTSLAITNNTFAGPFTYGETAYVAPATIWSGNVDAAGKAVAR